jgi:predicted aspartyl protease
MALEVIEEINVCGTRGQERVRAVIDTGAERSLLPSALLELVGAEWTDETITVAGWSGETSELRTALVEVRFPSLGWRGARLQVLERDDGGDVLIGMDVLHLLSLVIDTKSRKLAVKDGAPLEAPRPPPGAVTLPSGGVAYNVSAGYERRLRQLVFNAMKPVDPADIPPSDPDAPLPTTPRGWKVKPRS